MKTIVLIGQFTDISGYGHGVRSYFSNLLDLDNKGLINLKVVNVSFETIKFVDEKNHEDYKKRLVSSWNLGLNSEYTETDSNFMNDILSGNRKYSVIFFLTNNNFKTFASDEFKNNKQLNPLFTLLQKAEDIYPCVVWETDKPPTSWLEGYEAHKERISKLICACDWNERQFSKHTNFETVKIPYVINNKLSFDDDFINERLSSLKNKFNFVTVGQWGNRKGFDKLIKAFLLEFKNDKNVNLVIKSYYNAASNPNINEREFFKHQISLIKEDIKIYGQEIKSSAGIIIIPNLLTPRQINSLYHISDCYVTATRGEGFCYPIAEYSWFGKPIISPSKGGHIDLLPKESVLIDSTYEPVEKQPSMYASDMNYVECSINSTREKMRAVYSLKLNDPAGYDKLGREHREHITQYLNHERITQLFQKAIE